MIIPAVRDEDSSDDANPKTLRSRVCAALPGRWSNADETDVTPPAWELASKCSTCSVDFTWSIPGASLLFTPEPRHHCRNCGKSFCGAHSDRFAPLPEFELDEPQRVCRGCALRLEAAAAVTDPGPEALSALAADASQLEGFWKEAFPAIGHSQAALATLSARLTTESAAAADALAALRVTASVLKDATNSAATQRNRDAGDDSIDTDASAITFTYTSPGLKRLGSELDGVLARASAAGDTSETIDATAEAELHGIAHRELCESVLDSLAQARSSLGPDAAAEFSAAFAQITAAADGYQTGDDGSSDSVNHELPGERLIGPATDVAAATLAAETKKLRRLLRSALDEQERLQRIVVSAASAVLPALGQLKTTTTELVATTAECTAVVDELNRWAEERQQMIGTAHSRSMAWSGNLNHRLTQKLNALAAEKVALEDKVCDLESSMINEPLVPAADVVDDSELKTAVSRLEAENRVLKEQLDAQIEVNVAAQGDFAKMLDRAANTAAGVADERDALKAFAKDLEADRARADAKVQWYEGHEESASKDLVKLREGYAELVRMLHPRGGQGIDLNRETAKDMVSLVLGLAQDLAASNGVLRARLDEAEVGAIAMTAAARGGGGGNPDTSDGDHEEFGAEIAQLQAMGFDLPVQRLTAVLRDSEGNLETATAMLLS